MERQASVLVQLSTAVLGPPYDCDVGVSRLHIRVTCRVMTLVARKGTCIGKFAQFRH